MNDLKAIDDCWNKIGVHGDSSCPQLERHIHCRNCSVYSAAAAHLLDDDLPADDLMRWTRHIAQEQQLADRDTHSIVVFRIGAEWLALTTTVFKEIASLRTIHSVPHRRNGVVMGLVNVRGELLVCMSLRQVLAIEEAPVARRRDKQRAPDARLLVIERDGHRAVCPVDEVYGVERFHPQRLKEVPATVAKATATYTRAVLSWKKKSIVCLMSNCSFTLSIGAYH